MTHMPTIILMLTGLALVLALLFLWIDHIAVASVRNVNEHERQVLKRMQADAQELNSALRLALGHVRLAAMKPPVMPQEAKKPKQADRRPPKKEPRKPR